MANIEPKGNVDSPASYHDDTTSEYSADSLGKPTQSFETTLEEGRPRRGRRSWWRKLFMRTRRKPALSAIAQDSEGLLASEFRGNPRRKEGCYHYFVFGGISGLTILAILLAINLAFGILTYIWSSDRDPALRNWGKTGTGTEGLQWYPTDFTRDIIPIPCHSHNDYWRQVPLFSALRAGCTGVEADVWLFDDELYVGHNTASLTRNRTFQSLYVNPLVRILEHQNSATEFFNATNHGVFDTDPEKSLVLLVDLKTSGPETWPWVLQQLEPLRERGWLSHVKDGKLHSRQVTVVGTGNTPFNILTRNTTYQDAFFDAPLDAMWEARKTPPPGHAADWPDLEDSLPGDEAESSEMPSMSLTNAGQGMSGVLATDEFNELNSYYASVSFGKAVGPLWRGRITPRQLKIIRGQIRGAHRRGLKVRYWDLPSWPIGLRNHVWDVLMKEGADILNVDDLRAASRLPW